MNFLDLVKARCSVRSYEPRPVEQEKLDYILECVRLAPSAVNFQPWRFAVVTDPERLAALKTAYPREWIQTAPCIIVACGNHEEAWHRKPDGKDHTDVDVSIAVEHLCLAAAEQGLGIVGYATLMCLAVGRSCICPIRWNRLPSFRWVTHLQLKCRRKNANLCRTFYFSQTGELK